MLNARKQQNVQNRILIKRHASWVAVIVRAT